MTDSNRLASVSLRYSERRSLDSGRSNTSALDSYIYILWGKDLAAGAEGAVKYWRLLRGNPNIALLFNLRLFFSSSNTSQFIFFIFFNRRCKETLSASRGIYKNKTKHENIHYRNCTPTTHPQPAVARLLQLSPLSQYHQWLQTSYGQWLPGIIRRDWSPPPPRSLPLTSGFH